MADYSVTGSLTIDASGVTSQIETAKKGVVALQTELKNGEKAISDLTKQFEEGKISAATYNSEVSKINTSMKAAKEAASMLKSEQEKLDKTNKDNVKGFEDLQKVLKSGDEALKKLSKQFGDGEISVGEYNEGISKIEDSMSEAKKAMSSFDEQQKKSSEGTNAFANAMGEFLPDNVKKGVASLKDISKNIDMSKGTAGIKEFGKGIISSMSAGVKSALQFGVAINAATGGLLLVVGAVVGLVAAIGKISQIQGEYNQKVDRSREVYSDMYNIANNVTGAIEDNEKAFSDTALAAQIVPTILKKISEWITDKISPAVDFLKEKFNAVASGVTWLAEKIGLVNKEELKAGALATEHAEQIDAMGSAASTYTSELKKIEKLGESVEKQEEMKLAAMEAYVNQLAEVAADWGDVKSSIEIGGVSLKRLLETQIAERDALRESVESRKKQTESTKELTDLSAEIARKELDVIKVINQQDNATQSIYEKYAQMAEEVEREYEAEVKRVKNLKNVDNAQREILLKTMEEEQLQAATLREIEMKAELMDQAKKAAEREAAAENEIDAAIIEQLNKRSQVLMAQGKEQEATDALRQSIAMQKEEIIQQINGRNDLTETEKKRLIQIKLTTLELEKEGDAAKEAGDKGAEAAKKMLSGAVGIASAVSSAVGSIGDAILSVSEDQMNSSIDKINAKLESATKLIDGWEKEQTAATEEWLEEEMSRLEEMRNKALEDAGFIVATSEEGMAAAMEAAIATQDMDIIYKEEQRQKQLKINQKFDKLEADAKQKAEADNKKIEDKAAAERLAEQKAAAEQIAELQYQQAMAEWQLAVAKAWMNVPIAIASAFASGGNPIIGAILAAVAGAAATAYAIAVSAQAPKKPAVKFSDGGTFEGGVLSRPTTFKFADGGVVSDGVAGEAGNEGLLALERMSDGTLGVNASNTDGNNGGLWVPFTDFTRAVVNCANDLGLVMSREG